MSRFFRSALFPLIVIVLLVYLASQTLLPNKDERTKIPYSQLIDRVEESPEAVNNVLFKPKDRAIEATISGEEIATHYPSDEAQFGLQRTMEVKGVAVD
ncbi:MAG: hypothetical protein KY396_03435, partial [Actinobacteria bacterium]|nr:hypothetical protein [Actinomycetota bacterium]